MPICGSSLKELDVFGESLRAYFTFLKMFAWVFLICGGLASYNTYLNLTGHFVNKEIEVSALDYTTLANIYGFANMTENPDAANWVDDIETTKYFYYFYDFGISALLIISLFLYKVNVYIMKRNIRKN